MKRMTRVGLWLEALLALASGALALFTLIRSDWIESVFGIDPDQRSGIIEWLIVVALLTVSLILAVNAYRRARTLQRTPTRSLTTDSTDALWR